MLAGIGLAVIAVFVVFGAFLEVEAPIYDSAFRQSVLPEPPA
jgi:hypothetical protein